MQPGSSGRLHAGIIVFLALLASVAAAQQPAMFKGSALQSGQYPGSAITGLRGIKYAFRTGGPVRSAASFWRGLVFFGSSDGNLYALRESDGTEAWRIQTGGSIDSAPAVADGVVYFVSREGTLYSADAATGKRRGMFKMEKELPYANGWDYFVGSPVIENRNLYVGSGDGNLYALTLPTLKIAWKYQTSSRIRTSPVVLPDKVIVCGFNGIAFALDRKSGNLLWKFSADGVALNFEDAGYDRTSILGSPSYSDGVLVFGARDGFFYGLSASDGRQLWKVSHDGSWVLATAMDGNSAYSASGSSRFVQRVDKQTGKETWRFTAESALFAGMSWNGNAIYAADYAGNIYGLDKSTGLPFWKFALGSRIYSTPVPHNGSVYCGSDDGYFYAIEGDTTNRSANYAAPRKLVFYEADKSSKAYRWYRRGLDILIRDYFVTAGYELVDGNSLYKFLEEHRKESIKSVVVFATTIAPGQLMESDPSKNLLRRYLDNGGKVAFLGANPFAFVSNSESGEVEAIDFQNVPGKAFGLYYQGRGNINMDACYVSHATPAGSALGLKGYWTGYGALTPDNSVTVLATDQYGEASCWLKSYGGSRGTGLLQLNVAKENPRIDISALRAAIEYGLEW